MRNPNFNNLLKVLHREVPDRPTIFELLINTPLLERLSRMDRKEIKDTLSLYKFLIKAFTNAGYDYVMTAGSKFRFETCVPDMNFRQDQKWKTSSLNEGATIFDRASYNSYAWPDPDQFDYSALKEVSEILPEGMKLLIHGAYGMLENVIRLVGYENLCVMIMENEELVKDIFDSVCSRLVRYYEICAGYDSVGGLVSNDDWGFNTQTMLSPKHLRQCLFPWQKKLVDVAHAAGKPAILHSCGNLATVMDDIIDYMKFDAKHSNEDLIMPVEEAYEKWGSRIAILGGIDINYLCTKTTGEIRERSKAMLERTRSRGGYALGSGNSIPEYVSDEKYMAMISAAME